MSAYYLYLLLGVAGSVWLAMAMVDALVAILRGEWRFSIRGLLILTAVVSVLAAALSTFLRE